MFLGRPTYDQLIKTATRSLSTGDLADALVKTRALVAAHAGNFSATMLLAEVYERSGDLNSAIAAYDRAAALSPGDGLPFTRKATLQFRAAFGSSVPPRPSPPEQAKVSMTSIGINGRFGNQLRQYAFVRRYADAHQLTAEFPDWIGRYLFDLDDPLPSGQYQLIESETDLLASLHRRTAEVYANRDIAGYFGKSSGEVWSDRRDGFRALFRPGHKVAPLLDRARAELAQRGKTLVAIHIRHGDYGYGPFWIAPTRWYIEWLRSFWGDLDAPVLFIATDNTRVMKDFSEFSPMSAQDLGVQIPGADFYLDHYILSQANHLAISNSSFSLTAAMLNETAEVFARPDPSLRKLVAYDPWNARDYLKIPPTRAPEQEERVLIETLLPQQGLAVHVGEFGAPWTAMARLARPLLKIMDVEPGTPIDGLIEYLGNPHINAFVIGQPKDASAAIAGARAAFRAEHIEIVQFHYLNDASGADTIAQLTVADFSLFCVKPSLALEKIWPGTPLKSGVYLAVHSRMLPQLRTLGLTERRPWKMLVRRIMKFVRR